MIVQLLAAAWLLLPLGFVAIAAAGASYRTALAGGVILAVTATVLLRDGFDDSASSGDRIALSLIWLALSGWLIWINRAGERIFGQDVLLLPGIAQGLIGSPWLPDAFAPKRRRLGDE